MKTCWILIALALIAAPAYCLDLEGGPVIGLWPSSGIDIGGRIGLHLFDYPETWPIVGGHKAFADLMYVEGKAAAGASISLSKATVDDGIRLGVAVWQNEAIERKWGWDVYTAYALPFNLGFK
jgi:hypothetical protein